MRLPVEQSLRQDEMRRAAQIKAECVKPQDDEFQGRTLADDCAALLISALGPEKYMDCKALRLVAVKMRRLGARYGR